MRRSPATTLADVAADVGVSPMVVSVVLNGARSSTRVSDKTRGRVLEAAKRLGYRPNAVARGLSRSRMDTLGVVVELTGTELNFYYLPILYGILEAAAEHGQNTTVFTVSDWSSAEESISRFCDGRIDGMALIAPHFREPVGKELPSHLPFVTLHGNVLLPGVLNLDIDNEQGSYEITRFLIERDHRRIAHFAGTEGTGSAGRVRGFRRALREAGLPCPDSWILPGHYSARSGHRRMAEIIRERLIDPLPSAIVCSSDAIAFGCIEALGEAGLRVPEDISVVGFDDAPTARMTRPPLTTIRQPFREMGRAAVERLLDRIQEMSADSKKREGQPAEAGCEWFELELVVRESVGPPPPVPVSPPYIPDL